MDDEGSTWALAVIGALVVAAVIVGVVLLRNWFAYEVVAKAITQPTPVFPTTVVGVPAWSTPWALGTPLFPTDLWSLSTPTPVQGDLYVAPP